MEGRYNHHPRWGISLRVRPRVNPIQMGGRGRGVALGACADIKRTHLTS